MNEVYKKEGTEHVEWQIVYDNLAEYLSEKCTERGFDLRELRLDDYGSSLSRETDLRIDNWEKIIGKRLDHLYKYLEELSDGYLYYEIDVKANQPIEMCFDYDINTEELLAINDRYYKRVELEFFHKYSFYQQIATDEEVEDRYRKEIEQDFEKIGNYFISIIKERAIEKTSEMLEWMEKVIKETYDYYESDECIRDELKSKGSWMEENYKFLIDGTAVKDGEEGIIECKCGDEVSYEDIVQTEKDGNVKIVCCHCMDETVMKEVI